MESIEFMNAALEYEVTTIVICGVPHAMTIATGQYLEPPQSNQPWYLAETAGSKGWHSPPGTAPPPTATGGVSNTEPFPPSAKGHEFVV